jgi:hypothetical protein
MENQIQKINKEDNPLLFEMESKLDLLVKNKKGILINWKVLEMSFEKVLSD